MVWFTIPLPKHLNNYEIIKKEKKKTKIKYDKRFAEGAPSVGKMDHESNAHSQLLSYLIKERTNKWQL